MLKLRAILILSVAFALPAMAEDASLQSQIDEAMYAASVCPDLKIDEKRLTEILDTTNTAQSSVTKSSNELAMAFAGTPVPAPAPNGSTETDGELNAAPPPMPAVDPVCEEALAKFGAAGNQLPGLITQTSAQQ